jgi:hypothetical protein
VSAFRQDVTVSRYPTWDALFDYCRRSNAWRTRRGPGRRCHHAAMAVRARRRRGPHPRALRLRAAALRFGSRAAAPRAACDLAWRHARARPSRAHGLRRRRSAPHARHP